MNLEKDIIEEIPRLRRFARYLARDSDRADDLVQETLIRALGAAATFDPAGNLRAWLFAILRNVLRGQGRRQRRSPIREEMALDDAPETPQQGGQFESAELAQLAQAVRRMPPALREVIMLCGVEEFDYDEAATILGIPIGTVRSRLSRARALLRAMERD